MALRVVGAGVGRTGTNSLKVALETLLGGPCHHMFEMVANPNQIPGWTDAIDGREVDWHDLLDGYVAQVDWPGASFWPELTAANPDALVILSVRDTDSWYESAHNTIFQVFDKMPPELLPWFESVRGMMETRFCADLEDASAMKAAFERHNDAVREAVPAERLLEWTATDGWEPLCERLDVSVPDQPFPLTNQTSVWRENFGMPAI
ncbi:MAG TPA: sulfotransferase [Frankiaceae bacterium]|jgi:hypothetical protein|nr:sulfotransferase [Frankiaceae bacterium]